jgi:hypothetical protein
MMASASRRGETPRACGSSRANGCNFGDRFPRIVEAVASLPVQSCFIDGEAIVVDGKATRAADRRN